MELIAFKILKYLMYLMRFDIKRYENLTKNVKMPC
jgi:hypothetical protein